MPPVGRRGPIRQLGLEVDEHGAGQVAREVVLPSPVVAASSSFVCFAIGALVPLLPYLLGASTVIPALIMSLTALFICGAVVSRVTTRSWWYSGLRQLILGGAAAALTYGVGTLVGPGIG